MIVNILFLTLDEVLAAHERSIVEFGGSPGIRDIGLLQSALAMPGTTFGGQYLQEFPHEMATAYLFHIVQNHPFIDGNKRTGAAVARIFLRMNGVSFDPSEEEYGDLVLAVASGQVGKAEAIAFVKQHIPQT